MAIDFKIIRHNNYLEFVVKGSYDMKDAIAKFPNVLNACKNTGIANVLIDFRKLKYDAGGIEKILYAFAAEDIYLKYLKTGGHELRLAYLAPLLMSYEPGAEIGRKIKSLKFELFGSRDEALKWLNIDDT